MRPNFQVEIQKNGSPFRPKVIIGIPTTGVIRYEWHSAFSGMIIPTNWLSSAVVQFVSSPLGYAVAEARNLVVRKFLQGDAEWLFFIDHDVLPSPNTFIWLDEHMRKAKYPVIGGLYYTKGYPAEPLIYRGSGTGPYRGFKLGDVVKCDGLGMGFTLIHRDMLQYIAEKSPRIRLPDRTEVRKVFDTPRQTWCDPETGQWVRQVGTEDLYFLKRIVTEGALKQPRWKHLVKEKYPFIIDTNMFCWHIQMNGQVYPLDIDLPPGYDNWRKRLETTKWSSKGG